MKTRAVSGFTLIEIMVVMALMSIILGISSAFFTHFNRRLELRTTAGHIATLLRMAQNASLEQKTPTTIHITQKSKLVQVWGGRIAAYWSFERKKNGGALGLHAQSDNVRLVPGRIGRCFQFIAGKSRVNCGTFHRFGLRHGFIFSLWVYPYRPLDRQLQIIWQVDPFYSLAMQNDYSLLVSACDARIATNYHLPLYQWSHLRIINDGRSISLVVNHILLAQKRFEAKPIPTDSLLLIGKHWQGKIDEPMLISRSVLESFRLPLQIDFIKTPKLITFDSRGYLAPLLHSGAVTLTLGRSRKKERLDIRISAMGEVETTEY